MKIKKTLYIVIFNIILLFLIIFIIEFVLCNQIIKPEKKFWELPDYSLKGCIIDANNHRNIYNEQYQKPPIWLIGCSYAWGYLLDTDDSFGAKLSKYTKRPVYNWSYCGIGPAEALIRLYTDKNNKYLPKKPPEYVIYVYMYNHISRYPRDYNTLYALKKLEIIPIKTNFFDRFYIVKNIKQNSFNRMIESDVVKKKQELMKNLFFAMNDEVKKKYPNTKFIILLYNDSNKTFNDGHVPMCDFEYDLLNSKEYWSQFKEKNFKIITTKELIGREMDRKEDRISEDKAQTPHPTAEIWDIIIPKLVRKMNL